MAYESPELAGIPDTYIDKDHMYTGTKVITTGIAYNTDLVSTAPTSFQDLTKADYKDSMIMPAWARWGINLSPSATPCPPQMKSFQ